MIGGDSGVGAQRESERARAVPSRDRAGGGGFPDSPPQGGGPGPALRGVTLRRAYGGAIAIYLAALLLTLGFNSLAISLGLTAGAALGVGILASWHLVIPRAFTPGAPRRGLAIGLGIAKLPLVAAIVYVLLGRDLVNAPAFAVGFLIPQIAIALLAIGGSPSAARNNKEALDAAPCA